MRRMLAIVLCVLLASLSVCALSKYKIERFCERARHLRTQAIECMEANDVQQVEVTLVNLATYLDENLNWLEMLCDHEDLHDVKREIIDAQASIEFGIEDDFYQAIYRFGEGIEHIADVESLRLANLY